MGQVCTKCGFEHLDERTFCRRCGSHMDDDALSVADVTLSSLARDDLTWVNLVGETSTIPKPPASGPTAQPSVRSDVPFAGRPEGESVAQADGRLAYGGHERQRSPRPDPVEGQPRAQGSRAGTYMLATALFVLVLAVTAVYLASSSS